MFNRGWIEGEFNSHIIGSWSEELIIGMMPWYIINVKYGISSM